ncbi:MAG: hypothetical protein ABW048_00945 [Sphingobium sp.]
MPVPGKGTRLHADVADLDHALARIDAGTPPATRFFPRRYRVNDQMGHRDKPAMGRQLI